jgi:hypothetical protein
MKLNQLHKLARTSRVALVAVLALLSAGALQAANFFDNTIAGINLGNASGGHGTGHKGWAIFALQSATVDYDVAMQGGNTEARGNVAVAGGGSIDLLGGAVITGDLYLTGGSDKVTGQSNITGSIITNQAAYVNQGVTDAINASNAAAALMATAGSPTSIMLNNASMTISAAANTTYIMNLTQLAVIGGNAVLTLSGASTTNFIINVSANFQLQGGANILLSGGLKSSNVLYNLAASAGDPNIASGQNNIYGILLTPNGNVNLNGGSIVYGEVIAKTVRLTGGSKVINGEVSP